MGLLQWFLTCIFGRPTEWDEYEDDLWSDTGDDFYGGRW